MFHGLSLVLYPNTLSGAGTSGGGLNIIVREARSYALHLDTDHHKDVLSAALDVGTAIGTIMVFFM